MKNLDDSEFINNHYVLFCTKKGVIKKTLLEAYSRPRQNGVNAITLREDDGLIEVCMTNGNNEVLIANRNGRAIRFHENAVRVMGRTASGVRGMTLDDDSNDEVVGMVCIKDKEKETVLVVSEQGYGKRSNIEDYRSTNRGGKGVKTINITEKTGKLISIQAVTDDNDLMIINRSGLNNKGLYKAIAQLRHRHDRLIIGGNIGKNTLTQPSQVAADYLKMFRNLYQYVDYFSINACCDNCADGSVSHNKAHLMNILQPLFDFRRGQNQYRPILLKISPDLPDPLIDEVTDLMLSTPLDGIVAVNGTFSRKGLETDEETLDEIGSGRLSGAPLTQRAIEVVRRIHRRSHGAYPIIGVGGLMNARDVKAMLAAGASLVQLYTGYIYEGPSLVKEICRALIDDAASEASASPAPGK